ncbi:hypothetical protein MJO29_014147 [Puccinia striiformis f. sp. tritici]|nr:hypothetical protein MJO29_014147 [Puccinia striiformis f. sp. tritici]
MFTSISSSSSELQLNSRFFSSGTSLASSRTSFSATTNPSSISSTSSSSVAIPFQYVSIYLVERPATRQI